MIYRVHLRRYQIANTPGAVGYASVGCMYLHSSPLENYPSAYLITAVERRTVHCPRKPSSASKVHRPSGICLGFYSKICDTRNADPIIAAVNEVIQQESERADGVSLYFLFREPSKFQGCLEVFWRRREHTNRRRS